ncbi:DNA-binding transcriptional regulator, XRE-family HTH domain [Propionispira arboris]|uniref:DNA-binding transcriptional regulator, XRE-family HTH domain n=1 Tax=Propionispira arboris TaxID=84035 RepID=A0A1H7BXY8_9FIRM|nr:helix-turn-helix transcriptional regulator [Propionispira arboris]SEJ82331.1 DNA-binding transcriptional regulator, XRE-family HTH domain [Propionispira arboris]
MRKPKHWGEKMIRELVLYIKSERMAQSLTMGELALKSGVSQKHISNIENKKVMPTIETLQKLARALGFDIALQVKVRKYSKKKDG